MATIAELERELEDARNGVENDRERRNKWRSVANKKDSALEKRLIVVNDARDERDERREKLVIVRDKIEAVELDGVTEDELTRFQRLTERQEELVDANEELTSLIHRELGKIDRLDRQKKHAAHLRKRFNEELDIAIERRERLAEQLREAKQNRGPLGTEFFVLAEFGCHDGTPVPSASIPALKAHVHRCLIPFRARFGICIVNSAFRTYNYNRSIGGASMSVHVYNASWQHSPWAVATDIRSNSGSARDWYNFTAGKADGRGYYSVFHHCDNRNRIGWADAVWNGP